MGHVGAGSASACGLDKDSSNRPGVPDHLWISHRFCYLLLAAEEASALPDFYHQPDYSSGGDSCGIAGWGTHFLADAACGDGGAWFGVVSVAGGNLQGSGRR